MKTKTTMAGYQRLPDYILCNLKKPHNYKIFLILILLCISTNFIMAQVTIRDKIVAYKSLLENVSDTSILPQEKERAVAAALDIAPKGEFETTADFQRRQASARQEANALAADYDARIAAHSAMLPQRRALIEQNITALLESSLESFTDATPVFGAYDADNQRLPVSCSAPSFQDVLVVNAQTAQALKQNPASCSLRAERLYDRNLNWVYRNWELVTPSGVFPIGARAIAPVPVLAANYRPPSLIAELTPRIVEASGDDILDAGETGYLELSLRNEGQGAAQGLELRITGEAAPGLSWDNSVFVGELAAGQVIVKRINIRATEAVTGRSNRLTISFNEAHGFFPDPLNISFQTAALKAPNLILADYGVDSRDGMIRQGESIVLRLRVQNIGAGVARGVNLEPVLGTGVIRLGGSGALSVGDLNRGEYRDLDLELIANRTATAFPVSIRITEQRAQYSPALIPLELSLQTPQRTARDIEIAGRQANLGEVEIAAGLRVDIEENIPQGSSRPNAYGVILGIQNYRSIQGVPYAERDANIMREYFIHTLGIPEGNILRSINDQVTKSDLEGLFGPGGRLSRRIGSARPEIFVYFSGHGAPSISNQQAYLVPWEAELNNIENSCYPLSQLYTDLNRLPHSSLTVMIDACFSGNTRDSGTLFADARLPRLMVEIAPPESSIHLFSAARGNQVSWVHSEKRHGLFSYYLMKGMQGDADANRNNQITVGELKSYLEREVPGAAGRMEREQNPQIDSPDLNRVLIRLEP